MKIKEGASRSSEVRYVQMKARNIFKGSVSVLLPVYMGPLNCLSIFQGWLRVNTHCSRVSSGDRMEEWSEGSMELEYMWPAGFFWRERQEM